MKDLNLGPDTDAVIEQYDRTVKRHVRETDTASADWNRCYNELFTRAQALLDLLHRWKNAAWCEHDNSPAHICGGPHVQVRYNDDRPGSVFESIVVVERYDRVGTTFSEVPHHVITLPRP